MRYNENYEPCDYKKFIMRCLSVSTGDYANRFYKFKVIDANGEIISNLNKEERRYDIAETELSYREETNATAFSISKTFYYSGYAKGFGVDKETSTLSCRTSVLDTLSLDVKQTSFKFQNNIQGGKQVSSVYFSVPERYFSYGVLKKIKAEWNEYKTQPIVVTSNENLYNALQPYIGVDIGTRNKNIGYKLVEEINGGDINLQLWSYNNGSEALEVMTRLGYLFYTNGENVKDYTLSSEELLFYTERYRNQDELFLSTIDDAREQSGYNVGYNVKEIDSDERFDLLAYPTETLWQRLLASMYDELEKTSITNRSPIEEIVYADLLGDDYEVSKRILVDKEDVPRLRNYCLSENRKGNRVYIFRFAVSDYEARNISYLKDTWVALPRQNEAYRAQQTVFLDFDIIRLTFSKNEVLTVIPVVSSPVNISANLEPPIENKIQEFSEEVGQKIADTINDVGDFFGDISETVTGANVKVKSVIKVLLITLAVLLCLTVLCRVVYRVSAIVRKAKKEKKRNEKD